LGIHFGIAYISSYLKKNGYKNIKFLSVTSVNDYSNIVKQISKFEPDIVGFSSVETQFGNVIALSELIKKSCNCIIVCGGAFPTLCPKSVKDAPYLDGIFRGESEGAFLELVKAVEEGRNYRNIDNFCYYDKDNDRVVTNKLMPLETDLDKFGFADRDIFDFQSLIDSWNGAALFVFNRGCPYNCSFCSNHALAEVYGRTSNLIRRRSVESCIAEIKDMMSKYRFDVIYIVDDLFVANRKWLYAFLDVYKKEVNKPFMCTVRSNICDDELMRRLKAAGCFKVHMSVESGNDFIRNEVLNRNISRAKMMESYKIAKKYKIKVNASAVIGLPYETEDMIKETIAFLGSLKIASPAVNIFYPYIGTRLRDLCIKEGVLNLSKNYSARERRESVLDLPQISRERIQYYSDNFEGLVRRKEGFFSYAKYRTREIVRMVMPVFLKKIVKRILRKYLR